MRIKTQPSKDYRDSCSNHLSKPHCSSRGKKKGMRPAEVTAMVPVFEKSATELKLKQKLQKCKSTIQIAIFNVRTFNKLDQQPELTASAIDHNLDIICIQENGYIHSREIKYTYTGNGWTFVSSSAWKNCQRLDRRCRYTYRTKGPTLTK